MRTNSWSAVEDHVIFESSLSNFYSYLHYICLRRCPHCVGGNLKRMFYSENAWNVFRSYYYARGISPAILDFCLRKTGSGNHTMMSRHRFPNASCPRDNKNPAFSNSSSSKSVFEKLHFCDGSMWTVGLSVEIKRRFLISPEWCGQGLKNSLLRFFFSSSWSKCSLGFQLKFLKRLNRILR